MRIIDMAQNLHFLTSNLEKALGLFTAWKINRGNIDTLHWEKINDSLSFANIEREISLSLPETAISIIKVSGDIAPHKHQDSNSAGIVLSEQEGFPTPNNTIEIFMDNSWQKVERGNAYVFSAGTPHGFRGVTSHFYLLFLDSPPIDDIKDHILVSV